MIEPNNIYLMDCLDGMKLMEDKSVDVCFTSPPYNDTGKDGGSHQKYVDVETRDDWFEWQCQIIDEMLRLTKKYVLYNVQPIQNNKQDVYKLIGQYSNKIHTILIWNKPQSQPCGNPHKISNYYEFILVMSNTGGVDVNSDFYKNVITKGGNKDTQYAKIHKAVMSKELCDEIIREFTKPNDIVLDPFSGLGTTALSCKEQGRRYIGFEIYQLYYEKSLDRLQGIQNNGQTSLFVSFDEEQTTLL